MSSRQMEAVVTVIPALDTLPRLATAVVPSTGTVDRLLITVVLDVRRAMELASRPIAVCQVEVEELFHETYRRNLFEVDLYFDI